MAAARKKPQGRGAVLHLQDGEWTLVGVEGAEQLAVAPVVAEQRHRQRIQDRVLLALLIMLCELPPLGMVAMVGVAGRWWDEAFALEVLAGVVAPAFPAWALVARWAFRRRRGGG